MQAHYDISNDFYALWLGPTMMYSSGLWSPANEAADDLDAAVSRKIDFFARHLVTAPGAALLDVGCGWGGALRRIVGTGSVDHAVGLTLSTAQHDFVRAQPIAGADVRLESWADHEPVRPVRRHPVVRRIRALREGRDNEHAAHPRPTVDSSRAASSG